MSEKIPPAQGRRQATGGQAGRAPAGSKREQDKQQEAGGASARPPSGYGRQGGNAGTAPRNKKPWEKP